MTERLQPLRIASGWCINWNTLFEVDPTEESVRRGFFCGSSLFSATNEQGRLWLDVEWRPEYDPTGAYRLKVEYVPWERTEKGRRRKGIPLDFGKALVVHEYETRIRTELVRELETSLADCLKWVEQH